MDKKEFARELRRNMTPAEVVLWQLLRNRQLAGFKFRRQHAIDAFIVDFVCLEHKLVIEIDGAVHNDVIQHGYDIQRTELLGEIGYKVIRFSNDEVLGGAEGVLQIIVESLNVIKNSSR